MNAFVLFLVLLKATLTSFAGLASISVVRDELVVQRHAFWLMPNRMSLS